VQVLGGRRLLAEREHRVQGLDDVHAALLVLQAHVQARRDREAKDAELFA
jgi:hypothetical protein